ncbi:MAG TPA: YbhB/YbcL family Raf kinase inhibitor-like protein [Kofleriaceae bacterium]|nr:YbhB/YbcL family Raf kinase inhibitor-like protein [Kofleriaceae bacterium]
MRLTLSLALACAAGAVAIAAPPRSLEVSSPAFRSMAAIPTAYTCDGARKSPPLAWSAVPPEAKSIAILVDDPDAPRGVYTHWIVTDVDPTQTTLPGDQPGYTAPCPPNGTHRYRFHVYALDTKLGHVASRDALLKAVAGHVLAEGELVGTYARASRPR